MIRAHRVAQVREAESVLLARLPEGALMARAAAGLATTLVELLGGAYGRRVVLLVGPGDNGGDALWAGATLARRGAQVWAVPMAGGMHPTGLAALLGAGGQVVEPGALAGRLRGGVRVDAVVDGIVGIGGRPGLRPPAPEVLDLLAGVPVVAVDVPSGVDVDTGETPGPHVRADLTVTFGTGKPAHLVDPAAAACGRVRLVDLGLDLPGPAVEVLEPVDVAALLPVPDPQAQKYARGVVGVRAGSRAYPGAALLCVAGAATGLVGMVRYVGPADVAEQVRQAHPEVVGAGRVQAWCVGSGGDDQAAEALAAAVADRLPVVVDADALAHLPASAAEQPAGATWVLTPHAGELARMLDRTREEVEAAPWRHAREAAERWQATVLLKGRRTLVVAPDGRTRSNPTGTPWLATAGAGDVLTGLVGALLAAGLGPFDAASVGSWLHGDAAQLASGGGPLRAGDVARHVPESVRRLCAGVGESPHE